MLLKKDVIKQNKNQYKVYFSWRKSIIYFSLKEGNTVYFQDPRFFSCSLSDLGTLLLWSQFPRLKNTGNVYLQNCERLTAITSKLLFIACQVVLVLSLMPFILQTSGENLLCGKFPETLGAQPGARLSEVNCCCFFVCQASPLL